MLSILKWNIERNPVHFFLVFRVREFGSLLKSAKIDDMRKILSISIKIFEQDDVG